jgi:hypothetical protein
MLAGLSGRGPGPGHRGQPISGVSNGAIIEANPNGTHAETIAKPQHARTGWRSVPSATPVAAQANDPNRTSTGL